MAALANKLAGPVRGSSAPSASALPSASQASAPAALGSEVVLVSSRERVLPAEDAQAAAVIESVFARRGIVPEACSSWFLPRVVGLSRAYEMTLTGDVIDAEKAEKWGIVSKVVDDEKLKLRAGSSREQL